MDSKDKLPQADDIDRIISDEIPDKASEPRLYEVVKDIMIHGSCGVLNKVSSCMQDGRCNKFFPRKNVEKTTVDSQGYPIYQRRDNNTFIEKKCIQCNNRFLVPYNKKLLLGYNTHNNVEWCNQSRSIKYLFKYINKAQDRIPGTVTQKNSNQAQSEVGETVVGDVAEEPQVDEIKNYFDARYISTCESAWRILAFPTHYLSTPVEKLTFHLECEQPVIYKEGDSIKSVMDPVQSTKTMFLASFDCCIIYPDERELTYAELPTRFFYDGKQKVRGSTCYADIRTFDDIFRPSYEDACYERGLLDDDKEYIEGLKECSLWASSDYVRNLFVKMFIYGCLSTPELVWEAIKELLSEDVLYNERKRLRYPGGTNQAELIARASLIIWDEALMMSKHCFEALDRTMARIVKGPEGIPFGGIIDYYK
ncbi:hypothetical protein N665_0168s0022 [Sinapis alba]|nr:hypothetical protein N665_0168s0022 [Sinapis alba]